MIHNKERLMKIMEAYNLDAIIASTPENVFYLSEFWSLSHWVLRGTQLYVVYPRDKEKQPVIVMPASDTDLIAEKPSWINNIQSYGIFTIEGFDKSNLYPEEKRLKSILQSSQPCDSALEALKIAVESLGLTNCKIGLDEMGVPFTIYREIERILNSTVEPAYSLLQETRMVKTREEISFLKESARITESGIQEVLNNVKEGMSEIELYNIFEKVVFENNATPVLKCVLVGNHSASPNGQPTGRRFKKGDILRFDVGCTFNNYYSDTARTAFLGEPTKKHRDFYEAILRGEQEAINIIKPGVSASDIFTTAMEKVMSNGIPDYKRRHCGHGIGIEVYDPPLIASSVDLLLEEGMVLCIETPYYELAFGGLQVEDTIVVTSESCEYLTNMPRSIFVL